MLPGVMSRVRGEKLRRKAGPEQSGHTAWLWLRHKQVSLLPPGSEECLGLYVDTQCRVVKAADVTLGSENKNTPAPAPREKESELSLIKIDRAERSFVQFKLSCVISSELVQSSLADANLK